MTPLAAAWVNIATVAAGCSLTASSEATNMLVTKLQQEDTRRNFRTGSTTTVNIDLTYATTQSADTFFLANTNLSAAGIVRIQLSNVALGGTDVWDSNPTSTAGQVDPNYKDAVILASSVKSGWKYCRIILTDTSKSYLEAGFLFVSTRSQFDISAAWGAQITVIDPSIQRKTKGGQTQLMIRPKYRRGEFNFNFVSNAQKLSIVNPIDLLNGLTTPMLFIIDPSSSNLGRDSIFGLLQASTPVVMVQAFDDAGAIMSSKQYTIDQRL